MSTDEMKKEIQEREAAKKLLGILKSHGDIECAAAIDDLLVFAKAVHDRARELERVEIMKLVIDRQGR